jgi:hypothetical protein
MKNKKEIKNIRDNGYYCTEENCVIKNACYHQGKPTLCCLEQEVIPKIIEKKVNANQV